MSFDIYRMLRNTWGTNNYSDIVGLKILIKILNGKDNEQLRIQAEMGFLGNYTLLPSGTSTV